MTNRFAVTWTGLVVGVAAVVSVAVYLNGSPGAVNSVSAAAMDSKDGSPPLVAFTGNGELIRPTGYRKWIYVGAPLTPDDLNDGEAAFPEFHSVYIDPDAYSHYENSGEFPNGTVVIKELVSVGSRKATSGNGYFMGDFTGLEVLMKDRQRFRDQPGNWGFFSFGHEYPLKPTAAIQPVANCSTCHRGAADDDFIFTQYYPVLRAAKPAGR